MPESREALATVVQGLGEALADAGNLAGRLVAEAGQLSEEAAAHGWHGISGRMQEAAEALEGAEALLGSGQQSCERVAEELSLINDEIPAEEVAGHLKVSSTQLEAIVAEVEAAVEKVEEAQDAVTEIGQEGMMQATLDLHDQLTELCERIIEQQAISVREQAEADVYAKRQWGKLTSGDGGGSPAPPPGATALDSGPDPGHPVPVHLAPTAIVPRPSVDGWQQYTSVPARVRDASASFAARPEGTNRPTLGVLATAIDSGERQRIESGGKDRDAAADLRHDPLRGPPVTFYQHVEAKAAAIMRRQQIDETELILDNTVCGTTDRDRDQAWACHVILPSILPEGSRLSVWVTRDAGKTWWQSTYRGTGERILR